MAKGEVTDVVGEGVGAERVVGAVEELVVEVAGQVVGFLEVGFKLCGAAADVGVEQLGCDHGAVEHLGDEGEKLGGEFGHEVEGDVGGAGVG